MVAVPVIDAFGNENRLQTTTPSADRTTKQRQYEEQHRHDSGTYTFAERRIQDPSDHYFCGIGYADASESCEFPCKSGSTTE
jgi:hypothetical protein